MSDSRQRGRSDGCFELPNSKGDALMVVSITSVFLGLILSTIGYLVPREHTPNPSLSAREQESVDIYYDDLNYKLDICIIVGMGFIGLGGLLTSAVFCKSVICRECGSQEREETYNLTEHMGQGQGQGQGQGYGSVHGTDGQYRSLQ